MHRERCRSLRAQSTQQQRDSKPLGFAWGPGMGGRENGINFVGTWSSQFFGSVFSRLPKTEMMNRAAGYAQILNFLRYLRGIWNRTWDFYFSLFNLLVRNHLINFKWFCCGIGHLSWFFLWGASTILGWHPLMISFQLLNWWSFWWSMLGQPRGLS